MAQDILSDYGSDTSQPQAGRATNGGKQSPSTIPYSPPVGPKGQMNQGPGLHDDNCGQCGTQGKH